MSFLQANIINFISVLLSQTMVHYLGITTENFSRLQMIIYINMEAKGERKLEMGHEMDHLELLFSYLNNLTYPPQICSKYFRQIW